MNIRFNDADMMSVNPYSNFNDGTTTYSAPSNTGSIDGRGLKLDISSLVTDNNAYQGHGRTAEEVAMSAESTDLTVRRNYMAVMSNCLSTEDYERLQKDGVNPSEADFEETVTIVDHIKAALIKGGKDIAGYTDTMSEEALASITGSLVYAKELKAQFSSKDIPLTEDNVKEIEDSYKQLSEINSLAEGSLKYLIENDLTPSVDNIYTATFSSGNDASYQARGYYSAGNVNGYYARKADVVDGEALRPQIEKIIENASLEINDENINAAKWLIEKGIPLTEESLIKYRDINSINLPMSHSEFVDHATDAINDGIPVRKADLSKNTSLRAEAININDEVKTKGTLKGRRVLEEVRLSMTVEANLKLLRSGFQIDTAPMEELIKKLKDAEENIAKSLFDEEDGTKAIEKKKTFDEAVNILSNLKTAPITISAQIETSDNLTEINVKADNLKNTYIKANESYEELMTSPRKDMGDSINKAFRNVDELLSEMDLALTDENRRAVRILGYNGIPLTDENIKSVKEKDKLLTNTINEMTPGRVLKMLRNGVNPLTMEVSELDKYLRNQDTSKEDMLSYSKFLYKLEKDKNISDDEKEAYIGIYRLIRQIEKSDFSSIGAINEIGSAFSLENMLSALRSKKHKSMDYKISDSFSGVDIKDTGIASITSQIEKGFLEDTTDLKNMLNESGDESADKEFDKQMAEEIRAAYKCESDVLMELASYDQAISPENIESVQVINSNPTSVFDRLKQLGYKKEYDIKLDSKEEAKKSFKELTGNIREFLNNNVFGLNNAMNLDSDNVRQIKKIYQHMDFLDGRSDEENFIIPTQIGDETTAINLKFIHGDKKEAKVAISFELASLGKVTAQFTNTANGLSGICSTSNKEMADDLANSKDILSNRLSENGIELKNIYYTVSDNLDLKQFNLNISKDKENDTDVISTNSLYKAAKEFIEYVKDNVSAA